MSSQESNLDEEEMREMEQSAIPDSTSKATKHGVNKFTEWCKKRAIDVNFHTVTTEELATSLRKFYAEVKQVNGKSLSPSSMVGIRASLNRFVNGSPFYRNFNIVSGPQFIIANKMFDAKCKLYYKMGNKKPQHKSVITKDDMRKLGKYFQDWKRNAVVLTEAVWFTLCFHFGRRGREGWAELKKDSFTIVESANGDYVTSLLTESTKNLQGGFKQKDQDYSDTRMFGESVEMFQFYISKLNDKCDRLFQHPLPSFNIGTSVWFSNRPIGKNTLVTMMQRISEKANLSQVYTCHSVRASTITTLFHAGVSPQQIISITKHKNTNSLNHYISGLSVEQMSGCSNILSSSLFETNQKSSSSTVTSASNDMEHVVQPGRLSSFQTGPPGSLQPGPLNIQSDPSNNQMPSNPIQLNQRQQHHHHAIGEGQAIYYNNCHVTVNYNQQQGTQDTSCKRRKRINIIDDDSSQE